MQSGPRLFADLTINLQSVSPLEPFHSALRHRPEYPIALVIVEAEKLLGVCDIGAPIPLVGEWGVIIVLWRACGAAAIEPPIDAPFPPNGVESEGVMNEETSDIVDLIVDLVEEIAGDPESVEHLKNLIDLISGYLPSEEEEE